MALTAIIITGSGFEFERADGSPAQGSVSATLSETMQNGTVVVDPSPITGMFAAAGLKDQSGELPFTLLATDDPGTTTQSGTPAFYRFVIALDSALVQEFSAVVSHLAAGGTVDLSALGA